jgi:CspA family cold shock protein
MDAISREVVSTLAEGIVKWFSNKKGFGFIEQENGPDIFLHSFFIESSGFKTLNEGNHVQFDVEESARGPGLRGQLTSKSVIPAGC